MKTLSIVLCLLSIASTASFAGTSKTILKCSVGKVEGYVGERVNLLKTDEGALKANFIQGETVSGTMYHVKEVNDGLYEGTIYGSDHFWIRLKVSSIPSKNRYILGYKSSLQVVYPSIDAPSGSVYFASSNSDKFVCGKKIREFGE